MSSDNNYCNLLMDTNVILDFIHEKDYIKKQIIDFSNKQDICFIILEKVIDEWFNIEQSKYKYFGSNFTNRKQLVNELSVYGKVKEVQIQYYEKIHIWAEKMYDRKKYKRNISGDTLSRTDCLLLKYALEYDWTLVTCDILLIQAYNSEKDSMRLPKNIFVPNTDYDFEFKFRKI